jgi:hypothetical protein
MRRPGFPTGLHVRVKGETLTINKIAGPSYTTVGYSYDAKITVQGAEDGSVAKTTPVFPWKSASFSI